MICGLSVHKCILYVCSSNSECQDEVTQTFDIPFRFDIMYIALVLVNMEHTGIFRLFKRRKQMSRYCLTSKMILITVSIHNLGA